jgi:ABC-type glutathione transport system ATPase component
MEAETPGHLYACWYPVGSPEWAAVKQLAVERRNALAEARRRGVTMAGSGTWPEPARPTCATTSLLRVEDLVVEFPIGRTGLKVNAVSGHQLRRARGETLGLVGESGCGKSTTGGHHAAAAPHRRGIGVRGHGAHGAARRGLRELRTNDADDLPGPDLVAEPAPQGEATSSPSR